MNTGTLRRLVDSYRTSRSEQAFLRHLQPTDVFLVGHPKSGNTWLAYMLAVYFRGEASRDVTLANIGRFVPTIHGKDAEIRRFANLEAPRAFRTEWPQHPGHYPRTIYLVRDPRAVLVSYYHHYRAVTDERDRSIEDFIDEYLQAGCIASFEPDVPRWDRQVLEWLERSSRQPITFVRYEDMRRDRRQVMQNVLRFLSTEISETNLSRAVERGSFEAMKADEERHGAESYPGAIGKRAKFIRKGDAASWRQELSPSTAAHIEQEFREPMSRFGYTSSAGEALG